LFEAERKAQIDPLTGVLNRRSLMERLEAACLRARTRGLPISLLFIDLDHFKGINDSRGHPAGDACLKAIIAPIQAELRQSDAIGRYGGEEFLIALPGTEAVQAREVAERIRETVRARPIEYGRLALTVSASLGVACTSAVGYETDALVQVADGALYRAKAGGRNCVHG
jgi:diguanylate cyclase (GGDEF)-like protein